MSAEKRLEEVRSHPAIQKRIAEARRKEQFYNMLVEIDRNKHMVSREYYREHCDNLQEEVEKEIENMADEEAKSCYQVEFEKIMNGECGDAVYNGKSEFKFVADGCGCEFFKNSREHDECRSDKDGENWICGDCYQGEYDKECAHCGEFCPDEYDGDVDGDEEPLCEDCFEQMEKCEMCGDATDARPWKDIEGEVLHCSDCKDKRMREIAEAIAQIMPISAKAFGIAEEIEVIKQMRAEVDKVVLPENVVLLVGNSEVVEGLTEADRRVLVLKPESEDEVHRKEYPLHVRCEDCDCCKNCDCCECEPDEEFEAEVSNSHLLEVFGGEVIYNKLKALAKHPDLSSTLRVVWKFGKEHLSLYVYIEGEPFLDAVYPRNHSCDMFYMLEELKKEQEEAVGAKCDICGISTAGRKIRSLWNNALCEECGADSDGEECEDNE